jgi:thiosulfate/3-mercaptopyruvate sulfurtransferase
MQRIQVTAGVFLTTFAAALTSPDPSPARAAVLQPAAEILVTTEWLAAHLPDRDLVILHTASQRSDYDAGHIPGAQWLPWNAVTRSVDGLSVELPDAARLDSALESLGVTDASRIIISGGPITMTARVYFTLDYFGLGDRVALLDGGIDAWREEGRPLERAARVAARGSVTLRPRPDRKVDAAWIAARTSAAGSRIRVLDARVPEFWSGLSSNNNPRPGRVPFAQNVPFTWLTGEFARFRDRDRLSRLFERAGVQPGDSVVTYCHIGMQGSVLFVAARLLGYEAALYDGSFEDWSRRTDLPVAGPDTTRH